jgi:hypothetical protein
MGRPKRRVVVVDPADVQSLFDLQCQTDPRPDPDMASRHAYLVQKAHGMTEAYAREFARRVRGKMIWLK